MGFRFFLLDAGSVFCYNTAGLTSLDFSTSRVRRPTVSGRELPVTILYILAWRQFTGGIATTGLKG
jgi:hypothetical protein